MKHSAQIRFRLKGLSIFQMPKIRSTLAQRPLKCGNSNPLNKNSEEKAGNFLPFCLTNETFMHISEVLPHLNALLNLTGFGFIAAGFFAIRRGHRALHPKLMVTGLFFSGLFLIGYLLLTYLSGHQRFPGDDWVRKAFLLILLTHTALAVVLLPLVIAVVALALRQRFDLHRKVAHITLPIWLYVSSTGFIIYWMVNHLRPVQ